MQIYIDIDSKDVLADLTFLGEKLSPLGLRNFLELYVDPFLQHRVRERFQNEGDDAVGPWLPLSPATEAIRSAKGFGAAHPINVRTTEMLNFFMTSRADIVVGGGDAILTFPPKGGSSSVQNKIATAQGGKPFPSTPARPVVALSLTDQAQVMLDLQAYMLHGLLGSVTI